MHTTINEIDKNKDLLNGTGNYTQYFIASYIGKEIEKDSIYIIYKEFIHIIYIHIYVCVCVCVCIYIYRERERERITLPYTRN